MGKEYDFIVVGQGIAGTCLTSELQRLNKSVLVIDSSELPSASHVAGGLFNPVTGRAMVLTWMATTLFPFLDEFYSALEKSLGARFLHFLPLFRPFTNTEELNEWQGRLSQEKFKPFIDRIDTFPVYDELVNNPFGGVTLKHTGYVNTAVMLKAFRDKLIASANLLDEKFIYDELNFKSSKVVYKGNIAGKIIFANGPLGFDNEWVEKIRFQALKGEVLQLKMDVNSQVILNRNGFVLPRNGSHIAGSNYDKNGKDWEPTKKAQSEIKERIDKFLTDAMRRQMKESIHAAFKEGWIQLSFLEIGDQKAAAYLNLDYDNRLWVYNSAINYDFYDLSPGWVLLAYIIQWGIENGREVLDFMRGDEVYKYRFGGIDRHVLRVQIQR